MKVAKSAVRPTTGNARKRRQSYDKSRDEYLIAHFHVLSMSYWDNSTHRYRGALQQLRPIPSFAAPSRSSTNANIYSTFFLASQSSSTLRSSLRINLRNQLTSMCEMLKRHDNPSRRMTVQRFARVKTTGNRRTRNRKRAKNEIAAVRHFRWFQVSLRNFQVQFGSSFRATSFSIRRAMCHLRWFTSQFRRIA